MNGYRVEYTPLSQLDTLRGAWESLSLGDEMTYFQSFEWMRLMSAITPVPAGRVDAGIYAVYDADGGLSLLAPLWMQTPVGGGITLRGAHVYLLGRRSFSDYLNFIYRRFDGDAVKALMRHLKDRYRSVTLHFEDIKSESSLSAMIDAVVADGTVRLVADSPMRCAMLRLPSTYDEWFGSLSKGTRQNLRTAANRSQKDGVEWIFRADDTDVDRRLCLDLKNRWSSRRDDRLAADVTLGRKLRFMLRRFFVRNRDIPFGEFNPIVDDPASRLMTLTDASSGEIGAFFNYAVDEPRRQVVVMTAAVNEKFVRYSPGMLCMSRFIEKVVGEGCVESIDFTRGAEPYKFHLGATERFNRSVTVRLK